MAAQPPPMMGGLAAVTAPGAAQQQHAWFNPWEPPPVFTPAPAEQQAADRIGVTVKYAIKSGPAFLEVMRQKHQGDPNFGFLFSGDTHAYFRWSLYCAVHGLPTEKPLPAGWSPAHAAAAAAATAAGQPGAGMPGGAPTAAVGQPQQLQHGVPPGVGAHPQVAPTGYGMQPHAAAAPGAPGGHAAPGPMPMAAPAMQLPPEVESGFNQVLALLSGAKDSIKSSQSWFMACAVYAPGLVRLMAQRLVNLQEFDKQLHLIYLANDILFKALRQRPAGLPWQHDSIAASFYPFLGPMLAATFIRGGRTPEVRTKLSKILGFWSEQHVFDAASAAALDNSMTQLTDPGQALASAVVIPAPYPAPGQPQGVALQYAPAPGQYTAPHPGPQGPAAYPAPHGAPWQQQQQQQQPGASAAPWQQQSLQQPQQAPWQQAQQPVPGAPSAPPPWSSGALQPPLGHALNPHAHPHPHLAPPGPHAPPPGPGAAPWNVHSYPPPGGPHASAVAAALAAPPPDVAAAMGSGPNASSTPLSPHGAPYGQQQGAGGAGLGSGDRDLRSDRDRDRDRDWDRDRDRDRERDRDRDRDRGRGRDRERSYDERDRRDSRDGSRGDHSPRSRSKDRCDTPPSEPVNSMSFPPGLLPKLCYDKSKHSNPYEPLDPVDIEKLGLPPPPERDAYLRSRLEQFYAEIKDYRPGTIRTQMEETGKERSRDARDTDRDDDRQGSRANYYGTRRPTGMQADGSFAGPSASQYAGLGVHSHNQEEDSTDSYSQYRQVRSSSYHDMIAKNESWSNMARGGR